MARSAEYFGYWLEHDGKKVVVDGLAYIIHATRSTARYPSTQDVVTVSAQLCNTQSKAYRDMKALLGDDWSTDLLASDVERSTTFLLAAQAVSSPHFCGH